MAFDGSQLEYDFSQKALAMLLEADEEDKTTQLIRSKPGMLFMASPGTLLAKQLKNGEKYGDRNFRRLTAEELAEIYPVHCFSLPKDTLFWYHPSGFVIDPIKLCQYNLQKANLQGCKIIKSRAKLSINKQNKSFEIVYNGHQISADNVYLLAGAQNKEVAAQELGLREFNNTTLKAIATVRYKLVGASKKKLMPIILGALKNKHHPNDVCFSMMPESIDQIKARLTIPQSILNIDRVASKKKLVNSKVVSAFDKIFRHYFSFLGKSFDFTECVTYHNELTKKGLSFFECAFLPSIHEVIKKKQLKLITTLGCNGVHVKYSLALAKAMCDNFLKIPVHPVLSIIKSRYTIENYLRANMENFKKNLPCIQGVGNTPLRKIDDRIYAKLENYNPTNTVKDRVAINVLFYKLHHRIISQHQSIVVPTSGSYAHALLYAKKILNCSNKFIFVIPYGYHERIQKEFFSVDYLVEQSEHKHPVLDLIDLKNDTIFFTLGNFLRATKSAREIAEKNGFYFINQHYDTLHRDAHFSTSMELGDQLPGVTDIVVGTGSGATASNLRKMFGPRVKIHARPAKSGDIPGLTDTSLYKNYLDCSQLENYHQGFFSSDKALLGKTFLERKLSAEVSLSAGAAFSLAKIVQQQNPKAVIAIIVNGVTQPLCIRECETAFV